MAKLGEDKLGSVQFSTPTPFELEERAARERAEENMKSVYPVHEGTVWDRLLETILYEFEIENEIITDIVDERFVDTASQKQLGMIGDYFGIERRSDESDDAFRARIKSQLPRHTTRTTIDEILAVSASLLNTPRERITVEENFDIEPARFDVHVEEIAFANTDLTVNEFETLLQSIKAAGVRCVATLGPQFTYRSVGDYEDGINDPDKGYDDWDHDTIEWQFDEDDIDGAYGDDYGNLPYGGEVTFTEPGQVVETSVRLDVGGTYADEITARF